MIKWFIYFWLDMKPFCWCHKVLLASLCFFSSLCIPSLPTLNPTSSSQWCNRDFLLNHIPQPPRHDQLEFHNAHQIHPIPNCYGILEPLRRMKTRIINTFNVVNEPMISAKCISMHLYHKKNDNQTCNGEIVS